MLVKKVTIILLISLLALFTQLYPKVSFAQQSPDVSIEDAVYADLAIRHYLTNISVKSIEVNPNDNISINTDKQWLPASTVKVYVAMYAFKKIQDKELNSDDTILIDPQNVVTTEMETDELPALNEGQSVSVDRLIKQMITQSDNTAYNVLLDVLDRREVTNYINSLGLSHSSIGSKLNLDSNQEQAELNIPGYGINTTTADDYSKAFFMIRWGKVPGARQLYLILTQQKINNMIPLLLPSDVTVAHKTGDLDPLYHDGGIIAGPNRTYTLSIFSNLGDPNILAHISQLIYTKDYSLVGQDISNKPVSDKVSTYVDPLVLNTSLPTTLLGAKEVSSIRLPSINAADLGIKPADLSLDLTKQELPSVIIPLDSPLHFLVTATQLIRGIFIPKTQRDLDAINLKLAEASDLQSRNKNQLAQQTLQDVHKKLVSLVQNSSVEQDEHIQTAAETISETRFTLLGQELKSQDANQRNQTIKTLSQEAKETLEKIQPKIPQAVSATSLSQKPLIGDVTSISDSKMIVKTASGQEISVPIGKDVKIRQKDQANISTSQPAVGTTVALIGSSQANYFKASFILTNLSKQLVAPQPSIVLKVDPKNKTMVVSENGVPIQVDITNKTIIKGSGTNVSLQSIKPNDVVLVRGESIDQKNLNKEATQGAKLNTNSQSPSPQSNQKPQTNLQPSTSPSATSKPGTNNPNHQNQQSTNKPQTTPQPMIIKGTTIQVIDQHQTTNSKKSNNPLPEKTAAPKSNNSPNPSSNKTTKTISYFLFETLPERLRLSTNL